MGSLLIINANAVLSDEIKNTSVFIKDGKICGIGHTGKADTVLDIKGNYLLPGFVDVHVHGGGGADFMDATPDAIETVVKTHLKHGTTTLLPTAMSASENDLADFLNAFKDFKKTGIYSDIAPGVHLEGPYFSGANAKSTGAQPCDVLRFPDEAEMDRLMGIAGGNIVRWDAAPELPGAEMFAKKCIENGILPAVAHSAATSEETQNGFENGFAHITHFYNAVTTYHKEGQKVLAGVVEAAYLNDDITVELICDGKHIPRDIVRLALKIKGADKVSAITDGMRISGTNMKTGKLGGLKCGTDVIVDDGVAKLPNMSSFAGSIATMDVCLKTLCKDYEIDIPTASKMLSFAPAKLIGASKIGKIEKGYNADLVIADKNFEVSGVIKKGISVR